MRNCVLERFLEAREGSGKLLALSILLHNQARAKEVDYLSKNHPKVNKNKVCLIMIYGHWSLVSMHPFKFSALYCINVSWKESKIALRKLSCFSALLVTVLNTLGMVCTFTLSSNVSGSWSVNPDCQPDFVGDLSLQGLQAIECKILLRDPQQKCKKFRLFE